MRPSPAATLLLLAACSRAPVVLDEPPATSATYGAIPSAASSARVDPSAPSVAAPSASVGLGGIIPPAGTRPAPRIRQAGVTTSSNALPVEVIERIVRQNFGRFRLCYENGLRGEPALAGTVRVRFVIEADGATGVVNDAGSDLPDAGVVACVERAFGNLSFPSPAGGAMTVTYSLSFNPGSP
jgi:hypothetical protein